MSTMLGEKRVLWERITEGPDLYRQNLGAMIFKLNRISVSEELAGSKWWTILPGLQQL